jgi:hypothetical protein
MMDKINFYENLSVVVSSLFGLCDAQNQTAAYIDDNPIHKKYGMQK